MTGDETVRDAKAGDGAEGDPADAAAEAQEAAQAALPGGNRTIALGLLAVVVVMLVSAVGIAVLVLHFEAIHALPKL